MYEYLICKVFDNVCVHTHTHRERERERERGNTYIREKRVSSAIIITLAIIVVKKLR